jgi:hypothetical protein
MIATCLPSSDPQEKAAEKFLAQGCLRSPKRMIRLAGAGAPQKSATPPLPGRRASLEEEKTGMRRLGAGNFYETTGTSFQKTGSGFESTGNAAEETNRRRP